jgi:hypothetical protein
MGYRDPEPDSGMLEAALREDIDTFEENGIESEQVTGHFPPRLGQGH